MVSPWVGLVYALFGCLTAGYVSGIRLRGGKFVRVENNTRETWIIVILYAIGSLVFYLLIPSR